MNSLIVLWLQISIQFWQIFKCVNFDFCVSMTVVVKKVDYITYIFSYSVLIYKKFTTHNAHVMEVCHVYLILCKITKFRFVQIFKFVKICHSASNYHWAGGYLNYIMVRHFWFDFGIITGEWISFLFDLTRKIFQCGTSIFPHRRQRLTYLTQPIELGSDVLVTQGAMMLFPKYMYIWVSYLLHMDQAVEWVGRARHDDASLVSITSESPEKPFLIIGSLCR